jgi:hypothetical protein
VYQKQTLSRMARLVFEKIAQNVDQSKLANVVFCRKGTSVSYFK